MAAWCSVALSINLILRVYAYISVFNWRIKIGEEGNDKEGRTEESHAGQNSAPRNQALDQRRCSRLEGTLESAHAGRENLKANEENRWRIAAPRWDFRDRLGRVSLTQ